MKKINSNPLINLVVLSLLVFNLQTAFAGALSAVVVVPQSLVAGATTSYTLAFTLATDVPNNGKVKVTFPTSFNISGAAWLSSTGWDGGFFVTLIGQQLILTRDGMGTTVNTATTTTIIVNGIKNSLAAGNAGAFTVITTDYADTIMDTGVSANPFFIIPGPFVKLQLLMPGESAAPGTPASATPGKTGTPTAQTAGMAFNVTINAVDANWNLVNTVTDTVGITSSDVNAVLPANAALVNGTRTSSVTFRTAGYRTVIVSDWTDNTKTSNTSPDVLVNPAAATILKVSAIYTNIAAGSVNPLTVSASDSFGNIATGYSGLQTLIFDTASQPGSALPNVGSYRDNINGLFQVVAASYTNGVNNQPLIYQGFKAETLVLRVADGSGLNSYGGLTNNATFMVLAGAPTALSLVQPPTTTQAGAPISPPVSIQVVDSYGNPVTPAPEVDIAITKSSGPGTLYGTTSQTTSNGFAAFPNLSINVAAGNHKLLASSTTLPNPTLLPVESQFFTIQSGALAKFSFSIIGQQTAGVPFPITITAQDTNNNTAQSFNGTVALTTTAGAITPTNSPVFINGVSTFSVMVAASGSSQTITASGSGKTSTSDPFNIISNAEPGLLAPASVSPTLLLAGAAGNVTVAFTSPHGIPNNGTIRVTFPVGFGLGVASTVQNPRIASNLAGMTGFWTITSVAGQVLTLTQSQGFSTASGPISFSIPGISNPQTSGLTGAFAIATTDGSNNPVDINPCVSGVTLMPGVLTGMAVQPISLVANAVSNVQAYFTTVNPLPANGKVSIDFPAGGYAGFDLSNVPLTSQPATADFGLDGGVTVAVDTSEGRNRIMISRDGTGTAAAGGTAIRLTIRGIKDPSATGTLIGGFAITTRDSGDNTIDQNTAVPSISIPAGTLANDALVPSSLVAGSVSLVTINFTTANPIPQGGRIKIFFPDTFEPSMAHGQLATGLSGLDGIWLATVPGPVKVLILTQSGGGPTGAGMKSLTILGVRNPQAAGPSGNVFGTAYPFAFLTENSSGAALDYDPLVANVMITVGNMSANVRPVLDTYNNQAAGASGQVLLTFNPSNPLPANGKIIIVFPSGFTLPATLNASAISAVNMDAGFSGTSSGQTMTITRDNTGTTSIPSSSSKTLAINYIVNPHLPGSYSGFTVTTTLGNGTNQIDTATATAVNITTGTLVGPDQVPPGTGPFYPRIRPQLLGAGALGSVDIIFTSINDLPSNGKIQINFPAGFDISGANGLTASLGGNLTAPIGYPATVFTARVSGSTMVFSMTSNPTNKTAGAMQLTIGGIRNPTILNGTPAAGQTTAPYTLSTRAADGTTIIDQNLNVPGTLIALGQLAGLTVTPTSIIRANSSAYTFNFTAVNPMPSGASIQINFPLNYVITGVTGGIPLSGLDGTWSVGSITAQAGTNGPILILTQTGGTAPGTGLKSISVPGIANPSSVVASTSFTVQTMTGTTIIEQGTAAGPSIVQAVIQPGAASVTLLSVAAGAASTVTIGFTTGPSGTLSSGGRVKVVFPSGFTITPGSLAVTTSTPPGTSWSIDIGNSGGSSLVLTANTANQGTNSVSVSGIINPHVSGVTGNYTIYTYSDTLVTPLEGTFPPLSGSSITPGPLTSADILVSTLGDSLSAGATNNLNITFTSANLNPIPAGGKIQVDFPMGFNLIGAGAVTPVSGFGNNNDLWVATANGQTLTLIQMAGASNPGIGGFRIRVNGIQNPQFSGLTGNFSIATLTPMGAIIDQNPSLPGKAITAAQMSAATIQPASLLIGVTGNYTVSANLANPIPCGGIIKVSFPPTINLTGANGLSATTLSGLNGTWTATVQNGSQTITLTQAGGSQTPAGPISFSLGGIQNPAVVGTTTGGYAIQTFLPDGLTLIDQAQVGATTFSLGLLIGTSLTPSSLTAGKTVNMVISFTSNTPIPSDGKIKITFPSGYSVAGASVVYSASSPTGMDGGFNVSISGQTVTLTRTTLPTIINGQSVTLIPAVSGASPKSITLAGIINPLVTGATGTGAIVTTDSSDNPLDQDPFVPGNTISSGALSGTWVSLYTNIAGNTNSVTIAFTAANPIPANGIITFTLPLSSNPSLNFNINALGSPTFNNPTNSGGLTFQTNTNIIKLFRDGTGSQIGVGTAVSISIPGIINPQSSSRTANTSIGIGTYSITTATETGVLIDSGTVSGSSIVPGTLPSSTLSFQSLNAGATTTITNTLQLKNPIPVAGKIQIIFHANTAFPFDLSAASGLTANILSGMSGTWIASVGTVTITRGQWYDTSSTDGNSYPILTLTQTGGSQIPAGSSLAYSISGIRNPKVAYNPNTGSAPFNNKPYFVQTIDPVSGYIIDSLTVASSPTFVVNNQSITAASVAHFSSAAGATGNTTVTFTPINTIPKNGYIKVDFPAGYDLSPVGGSAGIVTGLNGGVWTLTLSGGPYPNPYGVLLYQNTGTGGGATAPGVLSFTIPNVIAPRVPGSYGTFAITTANMNSGTAAVTISGGAFASAQGLIETVSGIPGSIISAGAITADSVVPSASPGVPGGPQSSILVANQTGIARVTFSLANPIPADGKMLITFPAGYNLTGGVGYNYFNSSQSGWVSGSCGVSVSGQTIVLTRFNDGVSITGGSLMTIDLTNVKTPTTTGYPGAYAIQTSTSSGAVIDQDLAVLSGSLANTIYLGALTADAVTLSSPVAGNLSSALNPVVVAFTNVNTLPVDGKIKLTFGPGFILTNGVSVASLTGMDGFLIPSVNGQTLTLARNALNPVLPGTAITISLANVQNPLVTGLTGNYILQTTTSTDAVIDGDSFIPSAIITPGALTLASVLPTSNQAGAADSFTINFTASNPTPAGGKVVIAFPSQFVLAFGSSGIAATSLLGLDGTWTAKNVGSTLTLTQSGGSATAAGPKSLTIPAGPITNPNLSGVYAFAANSMQTLTGSGIVVDQGTPANISILAGKLNLTAVSFTNMTANASAGQMQIFLTPTNSIPANGIISVTFPIGFNAVLPAGITVAANNATNILKYWNITSGTELIASSLANVPAATETITTATVSGTPSAGITLALTRPGTGQAIPARVPLVITLANSGVTNPSTPGTYGPFTIQTANNSGAIIDSDTSVGAVAIGNPVSNINGTTVNATLSGASIQPPQYVTAGMTGAVVVVFCHAQNIPNFGKIKILMPPMFNVANSVFDSWSSYLTGGWSNIVSGQLISIIHTNGGNNGPNNRILCITNIVNP